MRAILSRASQQEISNFKKKRNRQFYIRPNPINWVEYLQKPEQKLRRQIWYLKKKYPNKTKEECLVIIKSRKITSFFQLSPYNQKRQLQFLKPFDNPHSRIEMDKGEKRSFENNWNEKLHYTPFMESIKKEKNIGLILYNKKHPKPTWGHDYVFELDIDSRGLSALFPNAAYNSNRIGSVKYYGRCKELVGKSRYKLKVGKYSFDFKISGLTVLPGSVHKSGNLYRLKRFNKDFFITGKEVLKNSDDGFKFCLEQLKKFIAKKEEMAKERKLMKFQAQQVFIELPITKGKQ